MKMINFYRPRCRVIELQMILIWNGRWHNNLSIILTASISRRECNWCVWYGLAGDEMQSLVSAVLLCPFTVLLQFRRGDKNFDWECTRHATLLHLLHCSLVRGGRGPPRKPVLESGTRSG